MVDIVEIAQDLMVIDVYSHSMDPFERLGFNDGIYHNRFDVSGQRGMLEGSIQNLDDILTEFKEVMPALPDVESVFAIQTAKRQLTDGLARYDTAYQSTKRALTLLGQSDIFYDIDEHDLNSRDGYTLPGGRNFLPSDMLFHQIDALGLPENSGLVTEIVVPKLTDNFYREMEYREELAKPYELLVVLGISIIDRQFGKAFLNPVEGHADNFWDEQVLGISRREMVGRLYEIAHR